MMMEVRTKVSSLGAKVKGTTTVLDGGQMVSEVLAEVVMTVAALIFMAETKEPVLEFVAMEISLMMMTFVEGVRGVCGRCEGC